MLKEIIEETPEFHRIYAIHLPFLVKCLERGLLPAQDIRFCLKKVHERWKSYHRKTTFFDQQYQIFWKQLVFTCCVPASESHKKNLRQLMSD